MVRWGAASQVVLADYDIAVAEKAAQRVNGLLEVDLVSPAGVDVTDGSAVHSLVRGADAILSCVPYIYNFGVAQAALHARVNLCDLGGHIGIARQQHGLDADAAAAGISIIPNCGQVPGMGTSLMVHAMELLDS